MSKLFSKKSKDKIEVSKAVLNDYKADLGVLNNTEKELNYEVIDVKDQILEQLNDLIIPDHLNLKVRESSGDDEALMQLYYEIFAELGVEGLEIVLTVDFLNLQNSDHKTLKQELKLLKDFFKTIITHYRDFEVNPLVLLNSMLSKNPNISIIQLIEITYKIERLITLSVPAKLHHKLMSVDWTINELVLLIENLEFINRESRYAGFKYLKKYLNSASKIAEEGFLYN